MQLNLKRLRKARSLTQKELAKQCDAWLKANFAELQGCNLRKIQKLEQGYYRFLAQARMANFVMGILNIRKIKISYCYNILDTQTPA